MAGGRAGTPDMFTPVALAGATQTSAGLGPELHGRSARFHVPGTTLKLASILSLILPKTLRGTVTMTVPISQMKTLMSA